MYKVIRESRFDRSLKKFLKKRKIDLGELKTVINLLSKQKELPKKYKNHKLKNNLRDFWECHIHSDVLLLHYVIDEENKLILYNLTTHDKLDRK